MKSAKEIHFFGKPHRDGPLQASEIVGTNRKWLWAETDIVGTNQVKLNHPDVPKPVAARDAWASTPEGASLLNREGLPASVCRTDEWLVPEPKQELGGVWKGDFPQGLTFPRIQ